jgi:hypothetical protein
MSSAVIIAAETIKIERGAGERDFVIVDYKFITFEEILGGDDELALD